MAIRGKTITKAPDPEEPAEELFSQRRKPEVGQFRLAHGFVELVLEFGGHATELGGPLPQRTQHPRQLFRADDDQRNDADEKEFAPVKFEHADSTQDGAAP